MGADKLQKVLSPIECFSWEPVDEKTHKLVYYDKSGKRFERLVPKETIEQTVKLFDGRSRLVLRNSGGWTACHPIQVLIYHAPGDTQNEITQEPIIRVRLRLVDLERDEKQKVTGQRLVVHYKVVPPNLVIEPQKQVNPLNHKFVMDFGSGVVPISVFDFYRDSRELVQAVFVRTDELEEAAKEPRGSKIPIQTYRIPEPAIRILLNEAAHKDFKRAKENLIWLKRTESEVIPEILKSGEPIAIPTGTSTDVLLHYLRVSRDPDTRELRKPLLEALENPKEEDSQLLPFGVFERV